MKRDTKTDLPVRQLYSNGLDTDRFARMLDGTTQSYKFFWLDAVMELLPTAGPDIPFTDIFNEMIWRAWYPVREFHLRMGPAVNGSPVNILERAVHILGEDTAIPDPARKEDIMVAIDRNGAALKDCINRLAVYVPYRTLSPFLDDVRGSDRIWNCKRNLIRHISETDSRICLPYTVIDGKGTGKKVRVNPQWRTFIFDNYAVIRGWIKLKKAEYLQDRNPGVPGVILKLEENHCDRRKLGEARKLWTDAASAAGTAVRDIYTGKALEKDAVSIDHFVPWSYVASDELWNLAPVSVSTNSSKGAKLPEWDSFFIQFAKSQFDMYRTAFSSPAVYRQFNRCRKDNLNSIWAVEMLYINNNPEERFISTLEQHLRPIYDSAKMQGYGIWNSANVTGGKR